VCISEEKVHRKDYGWSMGLVCDPKGLPGVTTARPVVVGVLLVRVWKSIQFSFLIFLLDLN
jgi:hypothetical protein